MNEVSNTVETATVSVETAKPVRMPIEQIRKENAASARRKFYGLKKGADARAAKRQEIISTYVAAKIAQGKKDAKSRIIHAKYAEKAAAKAAAKAK